MKWIIADRQTRIHIITAIILLVGLGSAISIYFSAVDVSDSVLIHQLQNSKMYRHDLEVIGGKANVLADDLCRWFDGLWHGKSLAFTVAFITILIAFGFFFVSSHLPAASEGGTDPDGIGR